MTATTPNPADELRQQINDLRYKMNGLHDKANLKSVIDSFTDVDADITNLSTRIAALRQRKYVFNKLLETTAADFVKQWASQKGSIQSQITAQSTRLQSNLQFMEMRISSMGNLPSLANVQIMTSEAEQLETQCNSIEDSIEAMFANIKNDLDQFKTELSVLDFTMEKTELASFGFLPDEAAVRAVKAVWCKNGKEQKDDPEGTLFLTDQRLLFEQDEEVATKKVLFVATEKKKIKEKLFEAPAVSITDVVSSKQGLFKNIDMLDIKFAAGCFTDKATLHIFDQPCEDWQKTIVKAKNHEIDSIRVVAVDQQVIEKVKAAPTQCPQCGGAISKPVLRGQDTITCEFCGAVIRL
jgi:hypothetical protein